MENDFENDILVKTIDTESEKVEDEVMKTNLAFMQVIRAGHDLQHLEENPITDDRDQHETMMKSLREDFLAKHAALCAATENNLRVRAEANQRIGKAIKTKYLGEGFPLADADMPSTVETLLEECLKADVPADMKNTERKDDPEGELTPHLSPIAARTVHIKLGGAFEDVADLLGDLHRYAGGLTTARSHIEEVIEEYDQEYTREAWKEIVDAKTALGEIQEDVNAAKKYLDDVAGDFDFTPSKDQVS